MRDHMLFHLVFLIQLLLISFWLPRQVLARMREILDNYPPETHGKLYPRSGEHYEKRMRAYRILNGIVLLAGLAVLGTLFVTPRSGEWDHVIATFVFFAQCVPLAFLDFSALLDSRLLRESATTRTADLRPRRLTDYVSPFAIGLAIAVYVGFALFVVYVRTFDYPWFGGYANIAGVTVMNLILGGISYRMIYGKKRNPYQANEDRTRSIGIVVTTQILVSIAATLYLTLNIGLAAFEMREYQPIALSLYFQLLAVLSFRIYRLVSTNFEVYRGAPSPVL